MSYTINDANIELEKIISGERVATLDELNKIFSNLDVTDVNGNTNAKTILYSGMGSSFSESLVNNPDVRILNNTQAFEFLEGLKRNEIFAEAWIKITGVKPDWQNDYSRNKK